MKVVMMCMMKVLPGEMAEYMELEREMFALSERLGMPPWRRLMKLSGRGDIQHSIVYEMEFANFAALDDFYKMGENPEMAALMPRFDPVVESHEHDIYVTMS
ncbi:MAG TPA: hypothetical protein G4N90_03765 [Dehalococcoidia bacterium]|nr:hypothetical protein [Dehalococcoidia bacterium]